jgi:hypothetical protein
MKSGRYYDPPFLLKMALLVCLVLVATAHRKGWMTRTVVEHHSPYVGASQALLKSPSLVSQP